MADGSLATSAESSLQVRRIPEARGSGGRVPPPPFLLSAGEIWKREGAIIRKRARKVRTTERGAHKFSCASAGTAVPLWTSSVLQ